MLKALIPVELTLASNIALRYLCQKSRLLGVGVQPIHVEEPDNKPHSSETGWIRKSWESGLRQAGLEEVQRILNSERLDCFVMPQPIVSIGSREDKILEELRIGGYDLFVEGEVANFNTGEFRKRLKSKLYRQMPCPVLIVRNMIQSDKVVLLLDEKTDPEHIVERFCHFFDNPEVVFDVCAYGMDDLHQQFSPDAMLAETVRLLEARGYAPDRSFALLSTADSAVQVLHDYGMLVANMDRRSTRKAALTEVLGRVSCPILLFW